MCEELESSLSVLCGKYQDLLIDDVSCVDTKRTAGAGIITASPKRILPELCNSECIAS